MERPIEWLNVISSEREAEHSVAGGLGKEGAYHVYVGENDAFDLLVATETASNTYCIYVRLGQCIAVWMGRQAYPAGVFRWWCLS